MTELQTLQLYLLHTCITSQLTFALTTWPHDCRGSTTGDLEQGLCQKLWDPQDTKIQTPPSAYPTFLLESQFWGMELSWRRCNPKPLCSFDEPCTESVPHCQVNKSSSHSTALSIRQFKPVDPFLQHSPLDQQTWTECPGPLPEFRWVNPTSETNSELLKPCPA